MIKKTLLWVDKNEDIITQVFVFGFVTIVAVCMMSLYFVL